MTTAFVQREFPVGTIQSFSGAIVDIPSTWRLCDGTHGTPDLRDRFIEGAGAGYPAGTTGGSVNHNHDFTGNGHSHIAVAGAILGSGPNISNLLTTESEIGTTDNQNGLPLYYSLAFIMYAGKVL